MNNAPETRALLSSIVDMIARSGRPDEEFFYLGGPMTTIKSFNFPRFHQVADKLRAHGENIVSPAELDDPETAAQSMASPDGLDHDLHSDNPGGLRLIARDLVVVELPTCVGGIFLEGWHRSTGAGMETWALSRLNKPLYEYADSGLGYTLTTFKRDKRLEELQALDEATDAVQRTFHHHRPLTDQPSEPTWLKRLTDPFGDRR